MTIVVMQIPGHLLNDENALAAYLAKGLGVKVDQVAELTRIVMTAAEEHLGTKKDPLPVSDMEIDRGSFR